MYMSYCRIEGTYQELQAVLNDVQDHINGEAEYPISERERECFKDMVYWFHDFMLDNCLIDEDGEVDSRELENVLVQMAHGADEYEEGGF